MKEKFIRTLSPITISVFAILDIVVIGFGIFAINELQKNMGTKAILFAALEVFAIVIAAIVTKEVLSNGVIFRDDEVEFTGLDENNIFSYDNIKHIEFFMDTAASLTKNFNDRHALLIFKLNDDRVLTVDLGLISLNTLRKIRIEFGNHIDEKKMNDRIIKKVKLITKKQMDEMENRLKRKQAEQSDKANPEADEGAENSTNE